MMIPVILSGGCGSRLSPLSSNEHPKQFLKFKSDYSLFQETVLRARNLTHNAPIIVGNTAHKTQIIKDLTDIKITEADIILEPVGRNTAPAITAAAFHAIAHDEEAVLLVMPADHKIEEEVALKQVMDCAQELATQGRIITFGVTPIEANTGYGYIQIGDKIKSQACDIKGFIEKPNEIKAQELIEQADTLWNSGIFCFKASDYLEALRQYHPEIVEHVGIAYAQAKQGEGAIELEQDSFQQSESISIDYALMEHTDKGCVIGVDMAWSDIGSWPAVSKLLLNSQSSKDEVIVLDKENNHVFKKLRAEAYNNDNLFVIEKEDIG